jgi:GNAT superfamily N-acetyltransferase
MGGISIRERETADIPRCLSVLAEVHRIDRYPLNWPDDPYRWLSPRNALHAWIAETESAAVVGHIAVHQAAAAADRSAMTEVEVSRLFVAPTARRQGVAVKLLGKVRQWAAEHRLDLVLDIVDAPGSAAAMACYQSTGWQHTHTATATWTAPDGSPVRLRRYTVGRGNHLIIEPAETAQGMGLRDT